MSTKILCIEYITRSGGFLAKTQKDNVKEAECVFSSFRNENSLFIILWVKA